MDIQPGAPIHFVRYVDKASPKLAEATASGKVFPVVEVWRKEGGVSTLAFRLRNAQITSYHVSSAGGAAPPQESLSFMCQQIEWQN